MLRPAIVSMLFAPSVTAKPKRETSTNSNASKRPPASDKAASPLIERRWTENIARALAAGEGRLEAIISCEPTSPRCRTARYRDS